MHVTEGSGVALPLVGLRVVDTTDSHSWSSARLLADLGADVIRVEHAPVPLDPLAATRHVNKRSIVCDDAQQLRALLADADVWFDSGGSGVDPSGDPRGAPATRDRLVVTVRDHRAVLGVRRIARRRLRAVRTALALSPARPSTAPPAGTTRIRGRRGHGRVRRAGRDLEPGRRR